MSAYVIVDLTPIDTAKLSQYSQAAGPTIASFGGQFVAKGPVSILHGDTTFKVKVVIEFPDMKSAKDWYGSPEYQAIIPLRNEAMTSTFQLVG